jgi:TPR repeat protein
MARSARGGDTASMGWGLTDLRFAVESQSWRRRRRVADCGPDVFGVRDEGAEAEYVPRGVDTAAESAVGSDRPLVVVTGDRLAGSSRTLHRAARRMLGDRWVLPLREPHTVDLADAVRLAGRIARRSGPVVVVADDAPPALLDQVTDDTCAVLGDEVRLLLTTRPTFLAAFLADATAARLDEATVEVPPASDGRPFGERVRPLGRARAVLDPVGWSSLLPLALLRAVVDWERLGVTTALTPEVLAEIAPIYTRALGLPEPSAEEVHRAARDGWRREVGGMRLWRRTRRRGETHLVPDRVFSHLADAEPEPAGWAVPAALARNLAKRCDHAERYRIARVALARSVLGRREEELALTLCADLGTGGLEPAGGLLVGLALVTSPSGAAPASRTTRAAAWLRSVVARGDGDLVLAAHENLGYLEYGRRDHVAARGHLLEVPDRQLAQSTLGTMLLAGHPTREQRKEALAWFEHAARGDDARAAATAALRAGEVLVGLDRDDDAEPYLDQAATAHDREVAASAVLELARLARRRGRRARAIELLLGLLEWVAEGDVRTQALVELGELRDDDGDADGAAAAFRRAKGSGGPTGYRAAVLLAELEVAREGWDAVEAAAADLVDGLQIVRRDPQLQARLLAARGKAALKRGDLQTARRCFERLSRVEGPLGELGAVRLGEVLSRQNDPIAAYRVLHPMQQASDPALAAQARALVQKLEPQVRHLEALAAQQRAVAAQQRAAMAHFIAPA